MINLNRFYYFKIIAEECNLTKAADILFLSQSTLSKSLSELESELGYVLFDRYGKRLKLNEYGKKMLEEVNKIFSIVDEIPLVMKNISGEFKNSLTITSVYPFVTQTAFELFWNDSIANGHLNLINKLSSLEEIIDDISSGKSDICISIIEGEKYNRSIELLSKSGIESQFIANDALLLAAPKREPFLSMESCELKDLEVFEFINHTPATFTTIWFEECVAKKKLKFEYQHTIDRNDFLRIWEKTDYCFITSQLYFHHKEYNKAFLNSKRMIKIKGEGTVRKVVMFYPSDRTNKTQKMTDFIMTTFMNVYDK